MKYRFKKYVAGSYILIRTKHNFSKYAIFDDRLARIFVERLPDAVALARLVYKSGAIIL